MTGCNTKHQNDSLNLDTVIELHWYNASPLLRVVRASVLYCNIRGVSSLFDIIDRYTVIKFNLEWIIVFSYSVWVLHPALLTIWLSATVLVTFFFFTAILEESLYIWVSHAERTQRRHGCGTVSVRCVKPHPPYLFFSTSAHQRISSENNFALFCCLLFHYFHPIKLTA